MEWWVSQSRPGFGLDCTRLSSTSGSFDSITITHAILSVSRSWSVGPRMGLMGGLPDEVRLAELAATLSLGTDLGLGLPMEHVIRLTLIALRLADRLGLDQSARSEAYYSGLLAWVGCHTDAYEQAKWFGDDITLKREGRFFDSGRPLQAAAFAVHAVGGGRSPLARLGVWARLPAVARRQAFVDLENHWRGADQLADQLGLGPMIRRSLRESFERWDGRGVGGISGDAITMTARLVIFSDVMAAYQATEGPAAAVTVARERAGTQFDPDLVEEFCQNASELLADLDAPDNWKQIIDREPSLDRVLRGDQIDSALGAIGDFADIKSPFTIGHSRRVADLAGSAAAALHLPDVRLVRRAALVHDLGRLGVSNSVWDKPGPLTVAETERVRLHPYLTERMLAGSPVLARLGTVAVQHHERLDGSGYPRGLRAGSISAEGRVLAAADRYATLIEERPHRPTASRAEAALALREDARSGRLDAASVDAVLGVAGHRVPRRRSYPAGLTTREVEILRLLTLGLSVKQIATRLTISPKTVGSHAEHIYTKTGATNRATLGLFAAHHSLLLETNIRSLPDEPETG